MPSAPKIDAKTRILTSALFLFNRFGVINVRLQHIADESGLSVGNLAYRYKTKDDLIDALYRDIILQQRQLLTSLRLIPSFENLNRFFHDTFALQQHYSFCYTDTLEAMRAYSTIRQTHREYLHWQTTQLENWLDFNIARTAEARAITLALEKITPPPDPRPVFPDPRPIRYPSGQRIDSPG